MILAAMIAMATLSLSGLTAWLAPLSPIFWLEALASFAFATSSRTRCRARARPEGGALFAAAVGPDASGPDFAFCDLQAGDYDDLRRKLGP